jgi:glycosyltransferase involved in cell wall biosynthesis
MSETVSNTDDAREAGSGIRVSVIIPIRNRVALLEELLEAIRVQTYPVDQFEVFVMDNRSTEDVAGTVEAFAQKVTFPIHYHLMEQDRGPVPARNLGAQKAHGEILAFTDSDCRPCPEWLELGMSGFTEGIALVSGEILHKAEQEVEFFSKIPVTMEGENPTYPAANIFYRKSVFHEFDGFDVSLWYDNPFRLPIESADTDLAWRIKKGGHASAYVEGLHVYHEVEPQKPFNWLIEPTKALVVPALVKRHPELRDVILFKRTFFYKGSVIYYAAVPAGIALAIIDWRLLAAVPLLILIRALKRTQGYSPKALAIATMQVCFNVARNYVFCLTMLYGSLRFRELVL